MKQTDAGSGEISDLRRKAEEALWGQELDANELSPGDVQRLLHELRVHQIELEMQNEELRRIQQELELSRDRYFDLYDIAPVGYFTIDESGLILQANLTGATMLGVTRDQLIERPFARFVARKDQDSFYFHFRQLLKTQNPQVGTVKLVGNDGLEFHAELNSVAVRDKETQINQCRTAVSDITARARAEERIQESLQEKEVLLKEIHHRVRNNLQVISSLLDFQADAADDERVRAAFRDSQQRIHSIARIHERLYRSEDLARIDMAGYIQDLAADLKQSYGAWGVTFEIEVGDEKLDIELAIPFGLIINELVTNAVKHAFPAGRSGEIRIALRSLRSVNGNLEMVISDNGVGLPAKVDPHNPGTIGLTVVNLLTRQLDGRMQVDRRDGTAFKLQFGA